MPRDPPSRTVFGSNLDNDIQPLWSDGGRVFCRAWWQINGSKAVVLLVRPTAEHPATIECLAHEYELREELDEAWAVRPLELIREAGRTMLVLEDPCGEPLLNLVGVGMEPQRFLRLAIGVTRSVGKLHRRGLIHKDLKPGHILVNCPDEQVRLTGFGLASRLSRERVPLEPAEFIAGSLPYMAPEQTGRMNRSVDSRSDLYSLGVIFYQMLTGALPFTGSDPLEWIHCHIARKATPPLEKSQNVPEPISHITMKLLAKTAEERYQTAAGLEHDLQHCLAAWANHGRIEPFELGADDTPDRLIVPEKLYGRAREIETLLGSFDRAVKSGAPRLVLVAGYSGIGKSSLVQELHKVLVPYRGLLASGKFDQVKRDVPYATLVQTFQSLVRPLLSKSEGELATWRQAFREALGGNGRLMVELIPDLSLVIGEQPAVAELPARQAQIRFQLVFRRFIGVFARRTHPLVLFLDDLQWYDAATLDLIEDLLTQPDLHLLLIGAYRSNEVDADHPLKRKLESIGRAGLNLQEITLSPLCADDVGQLVAHTLRCGPKRAAPLAKLVHQKTMGNPFFAVQFLSELAGEQLLTFDHVSARWRWDLQRIHAKAYTENVVDLMLGKLIRLPKETQEALQQLACFGNIAGTAELAIVLEIPEEQVHATVWPAIRQELIVRHGTAYRFVHDRVQEAAYLLMPESSRAPSHLRIGRMLAAHIPAHKREEAIFDIVSQLNRGVALIASGQEREQLAELNLIAGQRAKASAAYASALTYFTVGAALLAPNFWQRRRELAFALETSRAECEFLVGQLEIAERLLSALSKRALNGPQRATVACLRVDLYLTLGQHGRAVLIGLEYLRDVGIEWSQRPTDQEMLAEYQRMWSQLPDAIEDLAGLPRMTDQATLATLAVLTRILPAAGFTDANLSALVICRAVSISLEHGNTDASCAHYAWLGRISAGRFGDYQAADKFGRLACDLADRGEFSRFRAHVYLAVGATVIPWTKPLRDGRVLIRRALEAAVSSGDVIYEAYSSVHLTGSMMMAGDHLKEVQNELEKSAATIRNRKVQFAAEAVAAQLAIVRTMRGLTRSLGCFDDQQFDELDVERSLAGSPESPSETVYWIRKLQARFLSGDYAAAVEARSKAEPKLWTIPTEPLTAEFHFYGALSHSCYCDRLGEGEQQPHRDVIDAHYRQLQTWATNCPDNFENRAALVGAEIARLECRDADAMRLYEDSIQTAGRNGFPHHEGIACELAARFYAARGFARISRVYLQDARRGYLRWGADGKVRQLEELHPHLMHQEPPLAVNGMTIGAPVEQLDLATVIKVSQAISGEIVLQKLIDKLMRTTIEQAGAERGVLILLHGDEPRIEAEGKTVADALVIKVDEQPVTPMALPESVLHFVLRVRENVVLEDAVVQPSFAEDPYIRERKARSILCLPLITQGKLIGVLYLENNLAPRIFSAARTSMQKMLASQAATALENSRLYSEVQQREAKIRRLLDANIIGIFIIHEGGEIIEANQAFLTMVGYEQEDLLAGRVNGLDLTPPEWHERTMDAHTEAKRTGAVQQFEKEYVRKDGSRVPVLIGLAVFDAREDQGVGFVLDLTERKRAEAEARESERRYRETLMGLAHANRITTMGHLAASIAHEVNQPIAAISSNAGAGLNWLGAQPPNLEEVRQTFGLIVRDSMRAGNVIRRIRALMNKAPMQTELLAIDELILEVLALVRAELAQNDVWVQTRRPEALPLVRADRVQVRQVILNLITNAIEAMSEINEGERELLITTRTDGSNNVLVSFRDTGPGLDPNSADRMFEAFYTTKSEGMGMGLAICHSIIEAHGGRIWAGANDPRGAFFQFSIPVAPEGVEQAKQVSWTS
ncbi:AAA family ATPase [Bradyrhizobium sp. BWC-3-1]|uniref:trifunctional serine/threonine-protein kinase/ATP-binding protein/sensor histidine kinase n=1 Tax=Bradyrhizobium sp. BWC-3-1 TaxID=3080012 RepID=UPI00293ED156|nr:AAA family ATPase [Bradyrhizobium sp. BWC-3-1]WOH57564.1 AAA family ATPase [Bradyrhizobium sp. BWC-3-1]